MCTSLRRRGSRFAGGPPAAAGHEEGCARVLERRWSAAGIAQEAPLWENAGADPAVWRGRPGVELCVLGRISVVADGREHVLGSTREAALLADLIVHAGEVVPAGRLIDDLWRGEPPPSAAGTLQTYVKNLRRMLERSRPRGAPSVVLVSRRPGYVLRSEEHTS